MDKLSAYFIGDILMQNDDVFERARAIMLLRFCLMFTIVFFLPVITDIMLGYVKATVLHSIAFLVISFFPFAIKFQNNLDRSINLFFTISWFISFSVFMCLNSTSLHIIGVCWSVFFLVLGTLLLRGFARILFCCLLNWLPMLYVVINERINGALTWEWIEQKGAENPPLALMLIPISLLMYAVWTHTTTIQYAKQTINYQKKIIEEKNKDIIDSIRYARRIQNALLPSEKYIDKEMKRNKKD
ncbi:MAG: hypothetical protein H0W73_18500 [Bacteroidetes bacterium]|nr:hypothetical protein [Bacteroidota bacterium]